MPELRPLVARGMAAPLLSSCPFVLVAPPSGRAHTYLSSPDDVIHNTA